MHEAVVTLDMSAVGILRTCKVLNMIYSKKTAIAICLVPLYPCSTKLKLHEKGH